jgi:hypothetical protein
MPVARPISLSVAVAALILFGFAASAEGTDRQLPCTPPRARLMPAINACTRLIASGQFTGGELAKFLFWRRYPQSGEGVSRR